MGRYWKQLKRLLGFGNPWDAGSSMKGSALSSPEKHWHFYGSTSDVVSASLPPDWWAYNQGLRTLHGKWWKLVHLVEHFRLQVRGYPNSKGYKHWCHYIPIALVTQSVNNLLAVQETQVQSLGQEDPLGKEMATHFSILAWRIPWRKELGRLQTMGAAKSQRWLSMHEYRCPHGWALCSNLKTCKGSWSPYVSFSQWENVSRSPSTNILPSLAGQNLYVCGSTLGKGTGTTMIGLNPSRQTLCTWRT